MDNNYKYNLLKELLEEGERDKIVLAKKIGYTGATDKRLRDSLNRFLNNNLELKKLHSEKPKDTNKIIKIKDVNKNLEVVEQDNYKSMDIAPKELTGKLRSFEDLIKVSKGNPVIEILTNKILELEKDISNKKNYKENHTEVFFLDDKYNHIDQDDIIPVSLRMTRESKKALDKFCKDNTGYKKIHIVSQMIEEFVKKHS